MPPRGLETKELSGYSARAKAPLESVIRLRRPIVYDRSQF